MAIKTENIKNLDASTEEKILTAAKKIFTQRGYEATKVRDIAAEADINLSLVNYYFRSKEKVGPIMNNELLSLNDKVGFIAGHYIELLLENPDFPKFLVNEVLSGSSKIPAVASRRELIQRSHFAKQIFALQLENRIKFNPIQLMMNLMGMIVFPFLGQKLFGSIDIAGEGFRDMMEARKKLIPVWIEAIINS